MQMWIRAGPSFWCRLLGHGPARGGFTPKPKHTGIAMVLDALVVTSCCCVSHEKCRSQSVSVKGEARAFLIWSRGVEQFPGICSIRCNESESRLLGADEAVVATTTHSGADSRMSQRIGESREADNPSSSCVGGGSKWICNSVKCVPESRLVHDFSHHGMLAM
jgi:hypothetical protein